jgi:hypothetical protein
MGMDQTIKGTCERCEEYQNGCGVNELVQHGDMMVCPACCEAMEDEDREAAVKAIEDEADKCAGQLDDEIDRRRGERRT